MQGFRCPNGCGGLDASEHPTCAVCGFSISCHAPFLDFLSGEEQTPQGIGPRLMYSRRLARIYERAWRPMFVTVFGVGRSDIQAEFRAVRHALARAKGEWIADLSCGPGVMGRRLAACGDFEGVFGLDLSKPMLYEAANAIEREGTTGFELLRADIVNQPFLSASLDRAHAGAALHLWPDVPAALVEIARTLRPGAPFVATTFFTSPKPLIRAGQRLVGRSITTRIFDESWLRLELERAGFEKIVLHRRAAYGFLTAQRRLN